MLPAVDDKPRGPTLDELLSRIRKYKPEVKTEIDGLILALGSQDTRLRGRAFALLGRCGGKARPAVPAIAASTISACGREANSQSPPSPARNSAFQTTSQATPLRQTNGA